VLGGVFDRFPKLQIVIGHMGEGLPFFIQRVDVMPVELTQLKRPVSAYLRDNLHCTFAGFNFLADNGEETHLTAEFDGSRPAIGFRVDGIDVIGCTLVQLRQCRPLLRVLAEPSSCLSVRQHPGADPSNLPMADERGQGAPATLRG